MQSFRFRIGVLGLINKLPPFKGFNTRIPIIIPVEGSLFINQGSGFIRRPGQSDSQFL